MARDADGPARQRSLAGQHRALGGRPLDLSHCRVARRVRHVPRRADEKAPGGPGRVAGGPRRPEADRGRGRAGVYARRRTRALGRRPPRRPGRDPAFTRRYAAHARRRCAAVCRGIARLPDRRRPAAGGVRLLVRDFSPLHERRRRAARHVPRRDRAVAAHPRHGLRRAVFPADPSDRAHPSQGPQQLADARCGRSRQPIRDRQRGGGSRRSASRTRFVRAISRRWAARPPPWGWRLLSTSRSSARPIIRG